MASDQNKLAVVSGGTKGIGRAIIEKFMEEGFDIITCSRNEEDLEAMKSGCPAFFGVVGESLG